jgi:hypothetical protein
MSPIRCLKSQSKVAPMGIGTLLRYLIGERSAILTLADHPRTWLIGLVFVLSAGFAREYDGEDLLHEPWYLAIPLGASLVSSLALFCVLYLPSRLAGADVPRFFAAYRAFLGLFWMTAPLAWLYAVPYERLLDPVPAAHANLCTLALVAAWRVALMVRVGIVLFGLAPWASLFRVVAYSDTVALVAISFLPFSIMDIMGGVRLSEPDMAVRGAAQGVACWGGCSLIVWWLFAFAAGNRSSWALSTKPSSADRPTQPVGWSLRLLAVASLAIWIPILPFTQQEQLVRRRVEIAFREGRFPDALAELSAHHLSDFPPQWEPPPRFLKGDHPAMVLDFYDEILRADAAPWIRQHYLERFKDFVEKNRYPWHDEKVAKLLNQMPEGAVLLRQWLTDPAMQSHPERLDSLLRPELRTAYLKANR